MDPQAFRILMPLSNTIDELFKRIAEGNAKHQAKASARPTEPRNVDGNPDIGELKAAKDALTKEVKMMRDDWLKVMESFYTVQECFLTLCRMASPSESNQASLQNVQGVFGLPALLIKMKEELGQMIVEEKAVRVAGVGLEVTDEISDVEALELENSALRAQLKALDDGWLKMNSGFFAFEKHLVDIGLRVAPRGRMYPSQE